MTSHPIEGTRIAVAIVAAEMQLSNHDIEFEVLRVRQMNPAGFSLTTTLFLNWTSASTEAFPTARTARP